MKDIILAIDDSPERYKKLMKRLREANLLFACVQNPDAAKFLLATGRVGLIFLDHDMPLWEGTYYTRYVLPGTDARVVITSANVIGVGLMQKALQEASIVSAIVPCTQADHLDVWLKEIDSVFPPGA